MNSESLEICAKSRRCIWSLTWRNNSWQLSVRSCSLNSALLTFVLALSYSSPAPESCTIRASFYGISLSREGVMWVGKREESNKGYTSRARMEEGGNVRTDIGEYRPVSPLFCSSLSLSDRNFHQLHLLPFPYVRCLPVYMAATYSA